ncbi:hypothetical protein K490DRAFT_76189 [Saccharata proteae CBS 121410]|uniref:DUF7053 domain-containing protein n=1 Tax=Saccharata proteae CBS 121410 TaxID=1314787 RepID=A0A9P4HQ70_9PEZI|nr:hypothetical protein K490DRAFT_76189 [Saccharata proteae CBS 121410]
MSKRSVFTTITPLPAGLTRQTVLEFLHNHTDMIDLNPLVIDRYPITPPSNGTVEEKNCTWYTLKDRVSYLPGGLVTGEVKYNACFHDLNTGVQTHIYAPLGLDIKEKWTVGGSLPHEPRIPQELGLNIPKDGLYLREDCDMRCNIFMTAFVKGTLKRAHAVLVDRLVEKAGLEESPPATPPPPPHPPSPSHPNPSNPPSKSLASTPRNAKNTSLTKPKPKRTNSNSNNNRCRRRCLRSRLKGL